MQSPMAGAQPRPAGEANGRGGWAGVGPASGYRIGNAYQQVKRLRLSHALRSQMTDT